MPPKSAASAAAGESSPLLYTTDNENITDVPSANAGQFVEDDADEDRGVPNYWGKLLGSKGHVSFRFLVSTTWVLFVEGISGISGLAVSYYFKNRLHTSPTALSSIQGLANLPWTCKPLYGFISDAYPILNYRRRPYVVLAGLLGFLSWLAMANVVHDQTMGFIFLLLGSLGIAVANVISEAMVVERSRGETQEFAATMQSVIWGGLSVGGLIASFFGGFLLKYISDKQMFFLTSVFPLSLVVAAFVAPEKPLKGSRQTYDWRKQFKRLVDTVKQPHIFRPAAFVFMLQATPNSGSTWFFFYTDVLHFSSTFLGTIATVGSVATLAGVFLFQGFFIKVSFRKVFLITTIFSVVLGLSQLILIFRWNLQMGIPDQFFCLGESAVGAVVGWINTMPILVMASRLCPKGLEGTLYAVIMSVNNLGGIVGTQIGAIVTSMLGVQQGKLENFWLLVTICNLSTLLPLVFIHWVPDNDPAQDVHVTVAEDDGLASASSIGTYGTIPDTDEMDRATLKKHSIV